MAAVTHLGDTEDPADLAAYTSGSFSPATGDLLVVFVALEQSDSTNSTLTDSAGGSYALVGRCLRAASASAMYCYVRNTLCESAAARTWTWTSSPNNSGTACIFAIAKVTGMLRAGTSAIRQSIAADTQGGGGTPTTVFTGVALTGNPCIGAMYTAANPPAMTPPASFVELADVGTTPTNFGLEYASRDSGHTSATIAWGSTSATAYGVFSVELDTTAVPTSLLSVASVPTVPTVGQEP